MKDENVSFDKCAKENKDDKVASNNQDAFDDMNNKRKERSLNILNHQCNQLMLNDIDSKRTR